MEIQLKKGLIEALVLALMNEGDVYGYKLYNEVNEVMQISESTLYPILRRLESQGNVKTYQSEHNGRLRKYYSLTKDGTKRLNEYKKNLNDVKKIIEIIFS